MASPEHVEKNALTQRASARDGFDSTKSEGSIPDAQRLSLLLTNDLLEPSKPKGHSQQYNRYANDKPVLVEARRPAARKDVFNRQDSGLIREEGKNVLTELASEHPTIWRLNDLVGVGVFEAVHERTAALWALDGR